MTTIINHFSAKYNTVRNSATTSSIFESTKTRVKKNLNLLNADKSSRSIEANNTVINSTHQRTNISQTIRSSDEVVRSNSSLMNASNEKPVNLRRNIVDNPYSSLNTEMYLFVFGAIVLTLLFCIAMVSGYKNNRNRCIKIRNKKVSHMEDIKERRPTPPPEFIRADARMTYETDDTTCADEVDMEKLVARISSDVALLRKLEDKSTLGGDTYSLSTHASKKIEGNSYNQSKKSKSHVREVGKLFGENRKRVDSPRSTMSIFPDITRAQEQREALKFTFTEDESISKRSRTEITENVCKRKKENAASQKENQPSLKEDGSAFSSKNNAQTSKSNDDTVKTSLSDNKPSKSILSSQRSKDIQRLSDENDKESFDDGRPHLYSVNFSPSTRLSNQKSIKKEKRSRKRMVILPEFGSSHNESNKQKDGSAQQNCNNDGRYRSTREQY